MTEQIIQGDEHPAETAARRAAWQAGQPARDAEAAKPTTDEILDVLLDAATQTAMIIDIKTRRRP